MYDIKTIESKLKQSLDITPPANIVNPKLVEVVNATYGINYILEKLGEINQVNRIVFKPGEGGKQPHYHFKKREVMYFAQGGSIEVTLEDIERTAQVKVLIEAGIGGCMFHLAPNIIHYLKNISPVDAMLIEYSNHPYSKDNEDTVRVDFRKEST
jgi:mannose-6-phosphate isomerase-like protein (cupin superfamily)